MSRPDLGRRGLLRGLASLPLIGGSVAILGRPTAAAEPLSAELLDSYNAWLFHERRLLEAERGQRSWRWPAIGYVQRDSSIEYVDEVNVVPMANFGAAYHNETAKLHPSERAAIVLSAVGCDWRA